MTGETIGSGSGDDNDDTLGEPGNSSSSTAWWQAARRPTR